MSYNNLSIVVYLQEILIWYILVDALETIKLKQTIYVVEVGLVMCGVKCVFKIGILPPGSVQEYQSLSIKIT